MAPAPALRYLTGFGNEHASEAVPGSLPVGQNSPQRAPLGLYAEQISGTAFTAPRHLNRRSWCYRIRPGVAHGAFAPIPSKEPGFERWHDRFDEVATPPDQLRWDPLPLPQTPTDFIAGMTSFGGNGGPSAGTGVGILLYACNASMTTRCFYDADGELLIVPQQGRLRLATEMGVLEVAPGGIAVVPRGIRFRVELLDAAARGWVAENFGAPLRLPELGPIGSNGLANPRDFEYPVAAYEDRDGAFELIAKFQGRFHRAAMDHSPLDVVAWHGTHAPYRYELARFNAIGSISFDHPDPSVFTVLTSPSETPGTANLDLVVFGERWLAMEHTFRPPWYHRNVASEFMGLVHGVYDAKESGGFVPGGSSLHNCMSGHGPDAGVFEKASAADVSTPQKVAGSLAFMFETRSVIKTTRFALECPQRQKDYIDCWQGLKKSFVAPKR